ncbi:hypothetical protein B0H13DRAFT_2276744 [Mycena leptocephala]|nr:hypothetical protein B0H13DRAFT_2276744 [Mycena leptocephala]
MPLFTSPSGFQITGGTFIDNAGDINIHTTQLVQGPTTGALEFGGKARVMSCWGQSEVANILELPGSNHIILSGAQRSSILVADGESWSQSGPSLLNPTLPFSPQEPGFSSFESHEPFHDSHFAPMSAMREVDNDISASNNLSAALAPDPFPSTYMVSEQTEDGFAPSLHPPMDTSISYPSVNLGLLTDQFGEPADVRNDTSSVAAISYLPWDDPTRELKTISGGTFIGGNISQLLKQLNGLTIALHHPESSKEDRQSDIREQHIYLLYGLGGAGKTQITLKFISDSSCFTDKFFLDASTKETINTGLREIAVAKNAGNSTQDALKWLVNNHEKWVLFFDNADDPEIDLNTFLPQCNHGNIIITSRNSGLCVYAGLHSPVSDMEETDAVALLLKSAAQEPSSTNEKVAAKIVKELYNLPLAIVQAGAFISQSGDLDGYLDLYMQNRTQLLKEKPTQSHDAYCGTVHTTWQMSFNKLSQPAAMFLQLCSFLHRDGISEEIFSRAARYTFPSFGPSKEELEKPLQFLSQFLNPTGQWDSLCFLKVTNEIKAYSLVTFDPQRKVFSIHPLVHTWSQTTIPDRQSYHSIIGAIVGMSINEIPSFHLELASLRLISHIDSLMDANQQLASDFGMQCGAIYYHVRRSEQAKELFLSILEKQKRVLGDDHPDTLSIMNELASTYFQLDNLRKAEELYVEILEKRKRVLSDDHPDTLQTMGNLALTYHSLGEFYKGEKLEVVVLEKRKRVLGNDHPDTLLTTVILASMYRRLGKFHKAEELGVVVLEKQKRVLGDDHPNTLLTMFSLASTYCKLGEFHKAEELEVVVLEKQKKVLGDDHPNTLLTMSTLASTYHNLGKFHKAEELGVVVLEKQKRVLGDDHPDTLRTIQNLAQAYHCLNKLTEAEELENLLVTMSSIGGSSR